MSESIKRKFISGTSWTTGEQVILTILGVAQLSITSRLLTPFDFGIYAIALFFAGLGRVAFSMGLSTALIQKRGDVKPYLNTTWTASLLVATIISAFLMAFIPIICIDYYHNSDAIWPSLLIMLNCLFTTASNPYLVLYQKEIHLKKIFYLNVFSKLFSFVLVVICVYSMKSYWGLILAILSESFFRLVYSYILHPYRPQFVINWTHFKELYAFSGWIQLKNIVSWLAGSIDTAIVGNVLGTTRLGFYNRAQSVSQYAPTFINAVVDTVAFPLYSQINDDRERTNKVMISVQNFMIFLMSIVALLFVRYSDKIIDIILGEQWVSMANVFTILAVAYLFQALLLSFSPVLRSFGYTKQEFVFYVLKIGITVSLLYPFVSNWDIIGAAWAIAVSVIIAFPIMVLIIKKKTKLHLSELFFSIVIATLSVVLADCILTYLHEMFVRGWMWLVEMIISFVIIIIIETIVYFVVKKGPGETIYQVLFLGNGILIKNKLHEKK